MRVFINIIRCFLYDICQYFFRIYTPYVNTYILLTLTKRIVVSAFLCHLWVKIKVKVLAYWGTCRGYVIFTIYILNHNIFNCIPRSMHYTYVQCTVCMYMYSVHCTCIYTLYMYIQYMYIQQYHVERHWWLLFT